MRINGYRCDGCGKEHLLDPFYRISKQGDSLPDDWYMLASASMEQPRFFCTLSCLHLWGQSPAERMHRVESEDKKISTSQRRLTLILKCDFLAGHDQAGYIHARGRTVYELFRANFPEAEELDETIHNFEEVRAAEWKYTLGDAYDEHIAWAKLAKECGLIDHYVVDEVPA